MIFTTVTVKRGTGANVQVIATGIVAQIDQQSLDMMSFDAGAAPFDLFNVMAWTDKIARNDHLVDENGGLTYTVSARPEPFLDGHVEFTAMVPVGS